MTAPTDVVTLVRQYGVRWKPAGGSQFVTACDDSDGALDLLDELTSYGIVDAEIVSRPLPEWEISRSLLPDTIRALADFAADDSVTEETVRAKLTLWLANRTADSAPYWPAWLELVKAVAAHRAADDEGRSEDVKKLDEEIRGLVAKVIGRTR